MKPAPELTKIQTPTVNLEQESEKSPSKIRKLKREQAKKKKMSKYTIKSIDKAILKVYDLKSALYHTMHENKSFNRNPANHALYHALMKAFIEDENVMDKGVIDTVKNHKRQHDDDEDPSAGPNQGKKTKRRRTQKSESSKKPSITKETSKGKAPLKSSKIGKSTTAKEPVEEPIDEVVMDEAVNTTGEDLVRDDDQPQDISEPKTDKTQNPDWFKQPPRPPTSDPEWNKRQVVLDQPEQPWFNQMVSTAKDPLTLNDLMTTPIDFSKLDWNNLEGYRCPFDLTKPLPLKGRPGHLTIVVEYFFNNDLEFLKSSDLEKKYTTSITKIKAAWYETVVIEDMTHTLFSTIKHAYDKDAEKGIKHWGERRKLWYRSQVNKFSKHNVYSTQKILGVKSVSVKKLHGYGHLEEIMVKRVDRQLYKFKEGNFVDLHLNDIEDIQLLAVHTNYFISTKVTLRCQGGSGRLLYKEAHLLMVELIDKKMREIRIIQNLERLVGARELEMDYKLMTHIVSFNDQARNQRDLPQGLPLDRIEVLRNTKLLSRIEDSHHGPSDAMHNPPQPLKVEKTLVSKLTEITHVSIDFLTPRLLILKRWQSAPASDY
ncbi:hypothetical protein Tco_0963742 [Tanacetum coccineum]